jgi:hypothetical protein
MPRPSRQEQLDKAEAAARRRIEQERRKLAANAAERRALEKKALTTRTFALGRLVLDAGLGDLEEAFLKELLALLGQVVQQADPHVTLARCLRVLDGASGASVDGFAHAAHGVAPM